MISIEIGSKQIMKLNMKLKKLTSKLLRKLLRILLGHQNENTISKHLQRKKMI